MKTFDVVYVGMSVAGNTEHIKNRLVKHSRGKAGLWTHFSAFEVWDNIRDDEVTELEGLFREIYKADSRANKLNMQRGFKKIKQLARIECGRRDTT